MNATDTLQKLAEAASVNGDALKSMYELALDATQQLVSLNGDFVRSCAEACVIPGNGLDFSAQVAAQAKSAELTSEYLCDMSDVCIKTQAEIFTLGSKQADEITKIMAADFETLFQSFSGEHSGFADFWTSAFSAATESCEKFADTSRKFSESSRLMVEQVGKVAANNGGATARVARKTA